MKNSKHLLFITLGVIFWLNGVVLVRQLGEAMLTLNNPYRFWAFILAIPVTIFSLIITKYISKLEYSNLLRPVVIMTFTATLLDGLAFAFYRSLYSNSVEVALNGAALILWGAGLGLLFAYYLEHKVEKNAI